MENKRVAIIGSGTAGAATALFLSRNGHQVTLFEKIKHPEAVGAGVMLQPSGMRVLRELGLEKEILQSGVAVERLLATTVSKRVVLDLRYKDLGNEYYGVGLHRGSLFQSLYDSVRKQSIKVEVGVDVSQVTESEHDGCSLVATDGREYRGYDLVVIASGARTNLREMTGIRHTVKEYPWGALWFVAESGLDDAPDVLRQHLNGTHTMLGFLPTGKGPHGTAALTSLFWSIQADQVDRFRSDGLNQWKAKVLELAPTAKPILDQIHSMDQLLFAPYFDVAMPCPYQGSVIFLGDAAHATSPQLGQGCNLALVDALTFANAMTQANTIPAAFKLYEKKRRGQIRYYQWATRFLTPFFQSNSRTLGWIRDLSMGLSCRIPLISNLMISTMCGFQKGFFRSDRHA
jgi:2-polyprenyl-6-methoxyphenol hydroxylase-like FAD-dependent oxidoreductase